MANGILIGVPRVKSEVSQHSCVRDLGGSRVRILNCKSAIFSEVFRSLLHLLHGNSVLLVKIVEHVRNMRFCVCIEGRFALLGAWF